MFQGLSTALSGLYAARQALDTTGNNIANVNTEGYSRQRVDQVSTSTTTTGFFSGSNGVGTGVAVQDVARLRDAFLEARGLTEHSAQGELTKTRDTYSSIEAAFSEPSDNALQSQMSQFWSAWDDLANNPGDLAARSQVIEQAKTLTAGFQQSASALTNLKTSSVAELKSSVGQINAMAQNIADLNKGIMAATNAGENANALMDQRDLLVNKMSSFTGVSVQPTSGNSVAISIGGMPIVRDTTVTRMQVDDSGSPVTLRWDNDNNVATQFEGSTAVVKGGSIAGLMTTLNTILPKYQAPLDGVAQNLISMVNTQHALGKDQNGNPGGAFFVGTGAGDIAVDPTLAADTKLLAASTGTGGSDDAENARAMANMADSTAGADNDYRKLIDVLGTESQRASRQLDIQTTITNSVDASRQAVSGVNLDEEMTNMVNFQKAYTSSAKYLSVINDVMDTLMGLIR